MVGLVLFLVSTVVGASIIGWAFLTLVESVEKLEKRVTELESKFTIEPTGPPLYHQEEIYS